MDKKTNSAKKVRSEFWLKYFNRYLYENGLISHSEMQRMNAQINRYIERL